MTRALVHSSPFLYSLSPLLGSRVEPSREGRRAEHAQQSWPGLRPHVRGAVHDPKGALHLVCERVCVRMCFSAKTGVQAFLMFKSSSACKPEHEGCSRELLLFALPHITHTHTLTPTHARTHTRKHRLLSPALPTARSKSSLSLACCPPLPPCSN